MSNKLRYHLRFQIIPGKNVEHDARVLAKFCNVHGIEEVVLIFDAEEWSTGIFPKKSEDAWFDALRRIKPIMDKAGISCSLNPCNTVGHGDRGRSFSKDRQFKPMVTPEGKPHKTIASFADKEWQKYIAELYGRFATLGFRVLWVEDDFRYHGHMRNTWGGGFEQGVIERFEKKIGRKTTREEVLRNILKPGQPHPWRAKWMETWRELQLETAAGLATAVKEKSPISSKLGLMSSLLGPHSTEGRDFGKLFDALTLDGQVAHRPHFAGYSEGSGIYSSYSLAGLDLQRNLRPASAEVAPEIENYPHTHWSKSDTLTWSQMAAAMFYGSDVLFLNIFPLCANPADYEPKNGEMLDRSRPGLEWIAKHFTKDLQTGGVGCPWREDANAHVQVETGKDLDELDASPWEASTFLLCQGVPVSGRMQKTNAVFGSLAWAFSDNDIRTMLSGGLLLDARAAEILCKRGFAAEIGVEFRQWLNRDDSIYSMETNASAETGMPKLFYASLNQADRIAALDPRKGAREWTTVITPEKRRLGACVTAFKNRLGGRVVTMAVPGPGRFNYPYCYQRQTLIHNAIRFISGGTLSTPLVTDGTFLMPVYFTGEGRRTLVIFNGSPDHHRPVIMLPRGMKSFKKATLLAPLAKPAAAKISVSRTKDATILKSLTGMPYLSYLVVEL